MNCQAKIQDGLGNHYKCDEEAVFKITVKTIVPHLNNQLVTKVRCLCNLHSGRLISRHNYDIKHKGKQKTIIKEEL